MTVGSDVQMRFALRVAEQVLAADDDSPDLVAGIADEIALQLVQETSLGDGARGDLIASLPVAIRSLRTDEGAKLWAQGIVDMAAAMAGASSSAELKRRTHQGVVVDAVAQAADLIEGPEPDDKMIMSAAMWVYAGNPVDALKEPLRSKVLEVVGLSNIPRDELGRPPVYKAGTIYDNAHKRLGKGVVKDALVPLALAARDFAVARVASGNQKEARKDWSRGWGLEVLRREGQDIYRDSDFLLQLSMSGAQAVDGRKSNAMSKFNKALQRHLPKAKVLWFSQTGSGAMSLAMGLGTQWGRKRLGIKSSDSEAPTPGVLFFEGMYGGGRGTASGLGFLSYGKDSAPNIDRNRLPSPTAWSADAAPTKDQLDKEDAAIAMIRARAADEKDPIGALMIEVVQGASGVRFYRPEFLDRLRAVCDELDVPIIADEVLTGGGRTGKLFAYQHYDGFEPDVVVFGKAMQTAGVIDTGRRSKRPWVGEVTMAADPVTVARSTIYLDHLAESDLLKRITKSGDTILSEIRKLEGKRPFTSGLGLMIGSNVRFGAKGMWTGYRIRYLPPFDIQPWEIKEIFDRPMVRMKRSIRQRWGAKVG